MTWNFGELFHPHSFDLVTLARETVFSSSKDGVLVLDAQGKVVELNPSARIIFSQTLEEVCGKSLEQVLDRDNLMEDWTAAPGQPPEFVTGVGANRQAYELQMHPLGGERNRTAGRLVVLRDVTERRILNRELEKLAVRDELTGLANRRRLMELGERDLIRARRFGHPFSAIIFAVDHFKRINDTYGRESANQTLIALALIVQENIRDTDLLARYGGEEFVILLPETPLSAACEVAERIRKTVAEASLPTQKESIHVTLSLGVAESSAETSHLEDLLTAADNAMRKAKQAGRNRIFFAEHSLARHFYFDFLPA